MLEVKWKELQKKESEMSSNRGLSDLEKEAERLTREAMMVEGSPQVGQQRPKDAVDAFKDGPEQLKLVEFSTDGFTGEIKYTYKDGRLVGFSARGTTR